LRARTVAALAALAAAGAWVRYARAERDCARAERDARRRLEEDDPAAALALLDRVDARCRCARFTRGDAPPQYTLADAALRRLEARGEHTRARRLLAGARGPLLRDLARETAQ
jgi:hypothetical protein